MDNTYGTNLREFHRTLGRDDDAHQPLPGQPEQHLLPSQGVHKGTRIDGGWDNYKKKHQPFASMRVGKDNGEPRLVPSP